MNVDDGREDFLNKILPHFCTFVKFIISGKLFLHEKQPKKRHLDLILEIQEKVQDVYQDGLDKNFPINCLTSKILLKHVPHYKL